MWTNSSVTVNGNDRPAGLFLHGVQASSSIDGNHFHKLKESEIIVTFTQNLNMPVLYAA